MHWPHQSGYGSWLNSPEKFRAYSCHKVTRRCIWHLEKMKADDQINCEKIQQDLRTVFRLGRFQSWKKIQDVDVAYAESKKFRIIVVRSNPISQITVCHFLSKLTADVCDQLLLRYGRHMNSMEIVSCAKELLNNLTNETSVLI